MTLAEKYRSERKDGYGSHQEYMDFLEGVDPKGFIKLTDLGPVIHFSDGSKHLMDRK